MPSSTTTASITSAARDAASRLAEFRKSAALSNGNAVNGQGPRVPDLAGLINAFFIAAYQAEVFLSLDAIEDGEAFLREELRAATTDHERLSRSVVLGQMLLLGGKYPDYAELMMVTALPLLVDPVKARPAGDFLTETVASTGMLALLPLASREFLANLPEETLRLGLPRLKTLRASTNEGVAENIDWILYAVYRRLGMETERQSLAATRKGKGVFDEDIDLHMSDPQSPVSAARRFMGAFHGSRDLALIEASTSRLPLRNIRRAIPRRVDSHAPMIHFA